MALSGAPPTSSLKVVHIPAAIHTAPPPFFASLLNPKEAVRPVLSSVRRVTSAARGAGEPSTSVAASRLGDLGSLKKVGAGLLEQPGYAQSHFDPDPRLQQGRSSKSQARMFRRHCSGKSARHQKTNQQGTTATYGATGLSVLLNVIQPVGPALSSTTDQIDRLIPVNQVMVNYLSLADLDPATAKILIGITGPFLSALGFLFIIRIVMSWYPKLPVGQFPYVIAYAPTEPILSVTRRLIPPVGGVDVTPVVWFGLLSFLNEILVGPQGLLVLLSQQVQ